MHILVTRPQADAVSLKEPLEAKGHQVTVAPMIEIGFTDAEPLDLSSCSALIATSRNGLRGLEQQKERLTAQHFSLPLFAVGPGTAAMARQLGFTDVIAGPGSAADLLPVISSRLSPQAGPLVQLAGDNLAFDLRPALAQTGYKLRQPIVYRSVAVGSLPAPVAAGLAQGQIDAVVFMSPKTAQSYKDLVETSGLVEAARKPSYFCLSKAVAAPLTAWQSCRIVVADKPNLDEILVLIDGSAKQFR